MEEPSEERLDRHFEQQLIEFDSSFRRIACETDQILINFWVQIYRKAPKEQKLSRNCLTLLMYGHLSEVGYLQYPFTDMRNCVKDLNEVLDSYKGLPFLKPTNDTDHGISFSRDTYFSSEESSTVVSKNGSLTDRLKVLSASGDLNSLAYLVPYQQATTCVPYGATTMNCASNSLITYNSHDQRSNITEDCQPKLSGVQRNTINSSAFYDAGIISSSFPMENTASTCYLNGTGIISSSFPKENSFKTRSTYDVMEINTNAYLPYDPSGIYSGFAKDNTVKTSTTIDARTISCIFPTKSHQTPTISRISGISKGPLGNPVTDMFSSEFSQDQKHSTDFVSYPRRGLKLGIYVALGRLGSLRGWVTCRQIYFIQLLHVQSWYYYRKNLMRNYASLQLLQKLLERGSLSRKWQILSHHLRLRYLECVRKVCAYAKTMRLNRRQTKWLLDGMEDHFLRLTKKLFYKFYQIY